MSISNFLSPIEFRLSIVRLPEVKFFIQGASIPGINGGTVEQPNPIKTLYRPGTQLSYGDFVITVIADEDMKAYREITDWMTGLYFPASYDQYAQLKKSEDGLVSDITLTVLNSNKNANVNFLFKNAYPIDLSGIELNTRDTDVVPPTFTVTFKYDSYDIE